MKKHYDAIVIGAGPGGLSVATSLTQNGQKVLVVEKHDKPGGNCSASKFDDYTFDLAVHQLTGVGDKGQCGAIFREYGLADKLNFKQVNPFLVLDLPNKQYRLPGTWDAFRDELIREFPDSKEEIIRFLNKILRMKQDTVIIQRILYGKSRVISEISANDVPLNKWFTFPFTVIQLLIDNQKSGEELFSRYIKNEELKRVLQASWPYIGVAPKNVSGVMQAFLVAGQHSEQTYYPVGSSQTVADAMANSIKEHGGEILLNTEVQKILVENNRAQGIELPNGTQITSKVVISNADARLTYHKLIGAEKVPSKLLRKLEKMKPSLGPFKVLLGLDFNVAEHGLDNHEYMFFDSLDHETNYLKMASHCQPVILSAYTPTKLDPGLAPAGHSTVIMTMMVDWNAKRDWRTHTDEIVNEMIEQLEKRVPNVRAHIKKQIIFTPQDLNRFSGATNGAMYGWACTIDQVLINRFPQKSVVKELYHVGHWSDPGPGVTVAVISGWLLGNRLKKKFKNS
jgi:phytoene desaturase